MTITTQQRLYEELPYGATIPTDVFHNHIWFECIRPKGWGREGRYTDHRCVRLPNHKGRCVCVCGAKTRRKSDA